MFQPSQNFWSYAQSTLDLLQIHEDSPHYETLRDHMDLLWESLSEEEIKHLGGLASDLSWIFYGSAARAPKKEDLALQEIQTIAKNLTQALRSGERERDPWTYLARLRDAAPLSPAPNLAYQRATAMIALGRHDFAFHFLEYASRSSTDNPNYSFASLHSLLQFSPNDFKIKAQNIIHQINLHPPGALIQASLGLWSLQPEGSPEELAVCEQIVPALTKAIEDLQAFYPQRAGDLIATAAGALSLALARLHREQEALAWIALGLAEGRGKNQAILKDILLHIQQKTPIYPQHALRSLQNNDLFSDAA
jgi:hypothetical protein